MLLSDEKYGRQQHEHCKRQCHHATEYELFLKPHHRDFRGARLDRKSSRGMIYENEELRLRTININAEIERGQYDIKKLKKENELLKKEIWCLRDEYEKLDKLLKEKNIDFSSSSTTSESDTCSSCESDDVENSQNLENDQKTNLRALTRSFAALSVVQEESSEHSDRTAASTGRPTAPPDGDVIHPDESYPPYDVTRGYYAQRERPADLVGTISGELYGDDVHQVASFYQDIVLVPRMQVAETIEKASADVVAKTDNRGFAAGPNGVGYATHFDDDFPRYQQEFGANSRSTFSNGGNLEELLNDIETISQDILAISNANHQVEPGVNSRRCKSDINPGACDKVRKDEKPFKSELNVTLLPQPMALIGLEKYREIQRSMSKSMENLTSHQFHENQMTEKMDFNHFQQSSTDVSDFSSMRPLSPNVPNVQLPPYLSNLKDNYVSGEYFARYNPENYQPPEKPKNVPKIFVKQENDENCKIKQEIRVPTEQNEQSTEETATKEQKPKIGLRKKVSIHFRGKKEKQKKTLEIPATTIKKHSPVRDKKPNEESKTDKVKISHQKTSSKDSNKTTSESDTKNNPENRKTAEKSETDKKSRKSSSVSPERKKTKEDKKCKKHKKERNKFRRATVTSLESRDHRARSRSVNTERSNTYGGSLFFFDDYMNSERDSMSSSETLKTRQVNFSNVQMAGKVPWCGCWGNGCI